jgi:hypothetical protein
MDTARGKPDGGRTKCAGGPSLVEWFGYSPNFHDAEVVSIDLRRHPEPTIVKVHVWRTNSDLAADGTYRQDLHAHAVFSIRGIDALRLEGWNHQNVLSGLWIDLDGDAFVLHLPEIYGVGGEIRAEDISVTLEPLKADGT